ncbi:lactosylceramide 4-alpha-galactosyltransferase-like isoform X2 [Haemaphysalis longicornis]
MRLFKLGHVRKRISSVICVIFFLILAAFGALLLHSRIGRHCTTTWKKAQCVLGALLLYSRMGRHCRTTWKKEQCAWALCREKRSSTNARFLQEGLNVSSAGNISSGNYVIWFLETSYSNRLSARAACSIESACKHNPNHTIHLLTTGNIQNAGCPYHDVLSSYGNFKASTIEVTTILECTPLGHLYNEETFKNSAFPVEHLSDFLRYAVLWHRGGIYLDTDVIVIKSLGGLRNSAVYEQDDGVVASCVLVFDAGHPALFVVMNRCASEYHPREWAVCGPSAMSFLPDEAALGGSFNFLQKETFVAVKYQLWENLFLPERKDWVLHVINGSYGVHFWNKLSKVKRVVPGSACAMDVLAREHCPLVYKLASSHPYF